MTAMKNIKLKAFGLTEALIASVVIVLILSAAVALSSSSIKVATKNDTYSIASQISNDILERVSSAKELGQVTFDLSSSATSFPIECFDTEMYKTLGLDCASGGAVLPYQSDIKYSQAGFAYFDFKGKASSYPEDFFRYKVSVSKPQDSCSGSKPDGVIPSEMCRFVKVDVVWDESPAFNISGSSNEKHYVITEYFTAWEK